MRHKFPYKWTLKDANFTKDKGTVFSCFACGGGSTMGYKLAGFDVIGCNEIDPKMMAAYIANHNPKHSYLEPIQTFKLRDDLPDELYQLDILDGSPPCSSFSMAGNRGKDWGKDKKFREGQAKQVLDTLFFDFIDLAKKLQPKIVVAENVKGLLLAGAQKYVAEILKQFDEAGYYVDYTLLNAAKMGVPQRRERVFFTAIRKDLFNGPFSDMFNTRPLLDLRFCEKPIVFNEFYEPGKNDRAISQGKMKEYWLKRKQGDRSFADTIRREWQADRCFNNVYLYGNEVSPTLTSNSDCIYLFSEYRKPNSNEMSCIGTYPQDYEISTPLHYLIGMSVPPVMTAQIATRIYEQWLTKTI
jgi:DNA (cytosine-5)-methyltransferase 1